MSLIQELKKYKITKDICNFLLKINSYLLIFSSFLFIIFSVIKIVNIIKEINKFKSNSNSNISFINIDSVYTGFYTSLFFIFLSIITIMILIYYSRKSEYRLKEVMDNYSIDKLSEEEQNMFVNFLNGDFISMINTDFIINNFHNFNFENQKKLIQKPALFNYLCLNKDKVVYQNYENFIKIVQKESIQDIYENITLLFYNANNSDLMEIKEKLFKIYEKKNRFKTIEEVTESITYLELINYLRNKKIENIISLKYMIKNHNTTHIENKIFNLEKSDNLPSEITYFKFVLNVFQEMTLENKLESLQSKEFIKYIKDEINFLDNKYTLKEVYNDSFKEITDIIHTNNLNDYNSIIVDLFEEIEEEAIKKLKNKLNMPTIEENIKIIHI